MGSSTRRDVLCRGGRGTGRTRREAQVEGGKFSVLPRREGADEIDTMEAQDRTIHPWPGRIDTDVSDYGNVFLVFIRPNIRGSTLEF